MNRESKYLAPLKPLMERLCFSTEQARSLGIPAVALIHFEKTGVIQKLDKGIYQNPNYETEVSPLFESIVIASLTIPNSVICLVSALYYYDLTEEIPRKTWVAIPHSQRAPVRRSVKVVRMRDTLLGKSCEQIGEYEVQIFDRERCIIDAFRYLNREIAIKALQAYLRSSDIRPDLQKLNRYAKEMNFELTPYILSLTT